MRAALAFGAAFAALAFFSAPGLAAPQMLGVVATLEPIPMHCLEGVCRAELSALCLEKERAIPEDGTAYEALDPGKLALLATAADGSVHRIAADGLRILSRRSQVAVEVSLAESEARALGAVSLAVEVASDLALVPRPVAGDPDPLRAADLARAREALVSADALLAQDSERMRFAALLNRLINALPGDSGGEPAAAEAAWDGVARARRDAAAADAVLSELAQIYKSCRLGLADIWPSGLRRCLEFSHDAAMAGLNADLWKIVGAGS